VWRALHLGRKWENRHRPAVAKRTDESVCRDAHLARCCRGRSTRFSPVAAKKIGAVPNAAIRHPYLQKIYEMMSNIDPLIRRSDATPQERWSDGTPAAMAAM
jgi:hypothetical protein